VCPLIRNGRVVSESECRVCDVRFGSGVIEEVGPSLEARPGEETFDIAGRYVLPGLIDPHLHIKLDTGLYHTPDDWRIGTRAAALGGITTVIDFATQFPHQDFREAFDARISEIEGNAAIDYGLHMMITDRKRAGSMRALVERGVGSVKVYTTYRPNYFQDDYALIEIMREAAAHDLIVMVHAENDALVSGATADLVASGRTGLRWHGAARPEMAEPEAAQRCLVLAEEAGAALYVVHNSSPRTVDVIRRAREAGQVAWSETCPQYLTLDDSVYEGPEPHRFILQPPLRSRAAVEGLWERIRDGSVHVLGTDHCDYSLAQKLEHTAFTKTPGGLPGLETFLPLMHHFGVVSGRIAITDLVRLCSASAARIFGLWPRKGVLAPGSDADVVVVDPAARRILSGGALTGTAGYSPWEGVEVQGAVTDVWSRGERVVDAGRFVGAYGRGLYLPHRPPLIAD
jgi:dihydropyrimidinase